MTSLCRRLLPAVFMLTLVLPAHAQSAQSGGSASPPRQGQPGRSVQSGQPGPSPSRGGPSGPRGPEPWWREQSPFSKELGLTKEQTDRIEKLFQDTRPELNKIDDTLRRRENTLDAMIKNDEAETTISQQIDRVEEARGKLNKARLLMLVHMRKVLTPQQLAKFETLHAQWQDELRQSQLEREKQDRDHKQNQRQENQKPDRRSTPDRQGRPGL